MIDLSSLNENQLEAARWDEGPLLVLAGPGSGKTRVLALRMASLIERTSNKHFKILGLTFTNRAAVEMRERIAAHVPNVRERALLTTFHSFSAGLLRQHGHHIGLTPEFTIMAQDAERQSLLNEAMDQTEMDTTDYRAERLLPLVSWLIENNISTEDALEVLQHGPFADPEALATVYIRYRELMIKYNMLDFVGLIAEALGLLTSRAGIRRQVHRVYPYICVDEFQDTNPSQYRILVQLVNPETKNLFVVADDDQIIYQWNGASSERLRSIRDKFEMRLLPLPESYRCPGPIIELANKLIVNNPGRFAEKSVLHANKPASNSEVIGVQRFATFAKEACWVAEDIAARSLDAREKCVVLARTKKLLEKMVEALEEQGLSGYLAGRKSEFESASLQWLHSILRLANSRNSREYLRCVCKAFYTLEGISLDVHDIVAHASVEEGDYLRSWAAVALNRDELSSSTGQFIEESVLRVLADRLDFWKFQEGAFQWLDSLPDPMPDDESVFDEYGEEKATWHQLVGDISNRFGRKEITLHLLLQELDLWPKSRELEPGAIPCFTIHASKGMEFDHVYLVGMVEDQLPSWAAVKKGSDSPEMQEERRNCFVAITRAQETLTLTYADEVWGWPKKPSRFLDEMGLLECD